jgi:hypothetical protein
MAGLDSESGTASEIVQDRGTLKADYPRLKQNIEGGVPAGYEGHHIIPCEKANLSTAMKVAADRYGYNINNSNNGIALPATIEEARRTGLPLHEGYHRDYNEAMGRKLNDLDEAYASSIRRGREWDGERLCGEIAALESATRQDLVNHRTPALNADDPARRS